MTETLMTSRLTLNITVANLTPNAQTVHVFDTIKGGTRPIEASPFSLASGERSPPFAVRSDRNGKGLVAFRCQSGIFLAGIEVTEGMCVNVR
ncbi:hypothetical protein QTI66_18075 [Variovorax sp. J22R133]|uniref:hypothetical protein n=1 Tax=Variovorax brevis TaxID=3053503 RepID=UPI002578B0A7|nr:hypothetical protein [Variovorax sp. J22R133]MDM0114067.1 hypothetical protein [Variovorax sp. J22R133]